MKTIYADNASTTRLSPAALEAMLPYFTASYGNPSSLHAQGRAAAEALWRARADVAAAIGADPREIVLTSGGSEADNQAILSAAREGEKQNKKHIVSTAVEHHAVLHTLRRLEDAGFSVTLLPPDPDGVVPAARVAAALRPDTCLVSVMLANNEIGAINPVAEIGAVCRAAGVPLHTDAVQAVGHIPVDVRALRADLLSASAHKFRGPKGVGFLYARAGTKLSPLIEGGAQERGRRAGTENVPGAVGMAAALREAVARLPENSAHTAAVRDRLIRGLSEIPGAVLNGGRENRLPGSVSFCFPGVEGEGLVLLLDERGICASAGSACTSGMPDPSHVLLAIGRPPALARGALRLTVDADVTLADAAEIVAAVKECVALARTLARRQDTE